jgi:hypothetical protein
MAGRPDAPLSISREDAQMHPYSVKIRLNGAISYVTVNANSAGQAKQLVIAQFGDSVDVLSVTRQ